MASTFNIGGGPRSKKNLVSDCPGGGGCTVTLSGPWTILGIGGEVEAIEHTNEYFNIGCVVSLNGWINIRTLQHGKYKMT